LVQFICKTGIIDGIWRPKIIDTLKAACVQNCAGPDMAPNLERAADLTHRAIEMGAELIVTPELFSCLDVTEDGLQTCPLPEVEHPGLSLFTGLARENGVWINLGSLSIIDRDGQTRNRSFLVDADGEIVARYDKIHMFDVELGPGQGYCESDLFTPGTQAVLASTPWCPLGLTVCYDLRFPNLYRILAQAGALVITVPSAFTHTTGKAHWHTLLRARAIETGSFVIAPGQSGRHGRARTYGHSLIIDPWGEILAEGPEEGEAVILAEVDPGKAEEARRRIPALQHDRPYDGP
jgi:predicted amidohydrolase